MREPYLEVTFRRGKAFAAYYYLPRRLGQKSYKSVVAGPGLVVDLGRSGRPIGIEITTPSLVSEASLNRVLRHFGLPLAKPGDLVPLRAA